MKKNGKNKKCLICKKTFYVPKCLYKKKYCSNLCRHKALAGTKQSKETINKRIEKLRIPCSEEKKRKISKKLLGHKVSLETREKISKAHYIDGRSFIYSGKLLYGDDWDIIRKRVMLRDNYTCQHCKRKGKKLDVHHIVPFLIDFNNSPDNLIALCRSCHMKEENVLKRQYKHLIKNQRRNLKLWLSNNNISSRNSIISKGDKRGEIKYKEFEE